jgi:hypothetical protein
MRHGHWLTRSVFRSVASVAMALVLVFALPGAATAGGVLPADNMITVSGPQPILDNYFIQTPRPFWSVVALNSDFSGIGPELDYDLGIFSSNTFLGSSEQFAPFVDFVAIDSNIRPPQFYTARVHQFAGSSTGPQYQIEFHEGNRTLFSGRTILPADSTRHAFVADIFVPAGRTVVVTAAKDIDFCPNGIGFNYFFVALMASNPNAPVQGRNASASFNAQIRDGAPGPCGLMVFNTAARTGFQGLVIYQQNFERTLIDISIL